jgi:hypothetical protein
MYVPGKRRSYKTALAAAALLLIAALTAEVLLFLLPAVNFSRARALLLLGDAGAAAAAMRSVPDRFGGAKDFAAYCAARQYHDAGDYGAAAEAFALLGDYKDASAREKSARLDLARELLEQGRHQEAKTQLDLLGDYPGAALLRDEQVYQRAVSLLGTGYYLNAAVLFESIAHYKDSALLAQRAREAGG